MGIFTELYEARYKGGKRRKGVFKGVGSPRTGVLFKWGAPDGAMYKGERAFMMLEGMDWKDVKLKVSKYVVGISTAPMFNSSNTKLVGWVLKYPSYDVKKEGETFFEDISEVAPSNVLRDITVLKRDIKSKLVSMGILKGNKLVGRNK